MMKTIRSYSELISFKKFEDRFNYLFLSGKVSEMTFSGQRRLNQVLYRSDEWKKIRRIIIIRDCGCNLAHEEYPLLGPIYIHHLNPITPDDILNLHPCIFDLENLVCTDFVTHNAIHYGSIETLPKGPAIRTRNDTCPWRC